MALTNTQRIDLTNIAMIAVSAALAWVLPLQLFVFSYVVLGPLHYLTEIGWLHQKAYFTSKLAEGKTNYMPWMLILPVFVLALVTINSYFPPSIQESLKALIPYQSGILIGCLLWSVALVLKFSPKVSILYLGALVILAILLTNWYIPTMLIGLLIPTLVHVYLFTGLFMVQGAVSYGSWTTWLSIVAFVLAGLSFFMLDAIPAHHLVSNFFHDGWMYVGLNMVIGFLTDTLGQSSTLHPTLPVVLKWHGFIAFAYTYHYLNWFSKVDIIKWHKVPARWLVATVVCWVGSVGFYLYDLKMGLQFLYSLSMLHVVLEFPLNYRSISLIVNNLWRKIAPQRTVVSS